MFDIDNFKNFVGDKSATSYVSGLKRIETIFNVDIDSEFAKDKCALLLQKLKERKKDSTLNATEQKSASDMHSHLMKYIYFSSQKKSLGLEIEFKEWFEKQPQKNNPDKQYSQETVLSAIKLLRSGLEFLGIKDYIGINCFFISDISVFKILYDKCYIAAEKYDKMHGHSDFRNGLDFYYKFLKSRNMFDSTMNEKIKKIVVEYKRELDNVNKEELYKWKAIYTYKKLWNIEAPDFAEMLKSSFKNTSILLKSGNYYPYKMMCDFAEAAPETVRGLFRILYDETQPFEKRYMEFREGFTKYFKPQGLNHYQDLRAISVYLTFEYPEKYYIYKYTVLKDFLKYINYTSENIDAVSDSEKMDLVMKIYEKVLDIIKSDPELIQMSKARLMDDCYSDNAFHILTQDIIFFYTELIKTYWPPLDEYNPRITKDMWKDILNDETLTSKEMLDILCKMLHLGGESTCYHMAAIYGKTHNYYNMMGSNYGKRIRDKYNCPDCYDNEDGVIRYFAIPFVGRTIIESGKKHYSWKLRKELKEVLEEMDLTTETNNTNKIDIEKNIILYGPPGTGKTYNTAIYAVAIIENKSVADVSAEEYVDVLSRYNNYKKDGLIEFTTFHQSFGYEEFIEGIKPVLGNDSEDEMNDIRYDIVPGIFKAFCETAASPVIKEKKNLGINNTPSVWKVSLWGTGPNPTRTECLENGHIRIGYDSYGPIVTSDTDFSEDGGSKVLNSFIYKMKIGDIVLSCYSNTTIDAIGVITGEYEWSGEYDDLNRVRKVNWLVKGIEENILEINEGKTFAMPCVYETRINVNDVMNIVNKYSIDNNNLELNKNNYVFIIDEINRGNISKIFGELITLIEPTKRIGQPEEMLAKLPYSKKNFGVPDNVYIIGTMNTADRSIAAIDTALRRRFDFKEMLPQTNVLDDITVEDVSISDMLNKMNKRIEVLYDREHTIGHAYFMPLKADNTISNLSSIFKNKIIPLLQEYFYEDFEKIRLVLGDNRKENESEQFVISKSVDFSELFGDINYEFDDVNTYEINNEAFNNIEAYKKI